MKRSLVLIMAGLVLGIGGAMFAAFDTEQPSAALPPAEPRRPGTGQWLTDLENAYQNKDMDKIGQLIEQLKQQRQQFGPRPGERRRGPGGPRMEQEESGLQKLPVAKNDNEKKILAVLDDIQANQRAMNVPAGDGRLLRILAASMDAKNVVEIGTSTGYSGTWFGMALQKTGGKLTTFEIDAQRAAAARENFKKAGLADVITVVEGDAHEKVKDLKGPIDLVFLDADKEGYTDYLNTLLPLVRRGGLIIGHNITPGMADPAFVEAITTNPELETIVRSGVSITLKKL
ncbi:MAG: O-methyltransferase [Planctomycetaceae bacterium]|nr:O-methyltransferase [Planctomycetaceae bacterium]